MSEVQRYLLVDGHSVIFCNSELSRLHGQNSSLARERLQRQLEQLHDTSHWRVTLIFDGKGATSDVVKPRRGQMVTIYSAAGETADSVIERIVGQQSDRSGIVVVTADEAERRMVESLGAFVSTPEWLFNELKMQGENFKDVLDRMRRREKWG